MNRDFEIFNNYLNNKTLTLREGQILELRLIKSNYKNNSLYQFDNDITVNTKLLSYNDSLIKQNYITNPLVLSLIEKPLFVLMFTNQYFNFTNQIGEIFELIDLYRENIKLTLSNGKIMNLQNKALFDLTQADQNYITQQFGNISWQNLVNSMFENNVFTYSLVGAFFGIKINYWRLPQNSSKIEFVQLPVLTYLLNRMKINSPAEYNLLDVFYQTQPDKYSFYSFYLTFSIPNDVKKYYLGCEK